MFVCVCGKDAGSRVGLVSHQKRCAVFANAEETKVEAARKPDSPEVFAEARVLKETAMRTASPERVELHEDALEGAQDPEGEIDAAGKIAKAMGDRLPDPIKALQDAKRPAGVVLFGDDSTDGDKPPVTPREDLDALSQRLNAEFFRAGTENRFKWCREFQPDGPRHTFSRLYARERVLVDVYAERNRLVLPEVAAKIAALEAHNAAEPGDKWGYLAYVVREGIPDVDACRRALAGECVPLSVKPVEKLTLASIAS
jgi:hypothetical protein